MNFLSLTDTSDASTPSAFLPRLVGTKVALNVDGIERKRKKWSTLGKAYYRLGEWLATKLPNAIVTDAAVIQRYYAETYGASSVMIPYGSDLARVTTTVALERSGVMPGEYVLYVGRLDPENNADVVIRAFRRLETPLRLVNVGDAPCSSRRWAAGNCVVANDTPENREVVGDVALLYRFNDADDLRAQPRRVLGDPVLRAEYGRRAAARARECYA